MCRLWLILLCTAQFCVSAELLSDIKVLSNAAMQGRETGTAGAAMAREFIAQRYQSLALEPFAEGHQQPFLYGRWQKKDGINMLAFRRGCRYPDHYIVVSAHYDHIGQQGRTVFHGADDNASGVAALLELAGRLAAICPAYSYIFLATDAEEDGLYGSKAFVAQPPVPLNQLVLNLNLDMISRADNRGRLYLTGVRRYPALKQELATEFNKLLFLTHRGPNSYHGSGFAWVESSDHGPFFRAGIPYLFFGGQEHPDYHTKNDIWQKIDPVFLDMAMQVIWRTVQWVERQPPVALQPR